MTQLSIRTPEFNNKSLSVPAPLNMELRSFKGDSDGHAVGAPAFIKFLEKSVGEMTPSNLQFDSALRFMRGRYIMGLVQVSSNKVAVLHADNSSYYSYLTVIKIENGIMSLDSQTLISGTANDGKFGSIASLEENKIIVINYNSAGTNLAARVCTVGNGTLTVGTATLIGDSYIQVRCVALSSTKFVVTFGKSAYYAYMIVCNVSGTTISAGSIVKPDDTYTGTEYNLELLKLSSTKVMLFHRNSANIGAIICDISGTSVTAGTYTSFCSGYQIPNAPQAFLAKTGLVVAGYAFYNSKKSAAGGYAQYSAFPIAQTIIYSGRTMTVGAATATAPVLIQGGQQTAVFYDKEITVSGAKQYQFWEWRDAFTSSISVDDIRTIVCQTAGTASNAISVISTTRTPYALGATSSIGRHEALHYVDPVNGRTYIIDVEIQTNYNLALILGGVNSTEIIVDYADDEAYGVTETTCSPDTPGDVWVFANSVPSAGGYGKVYYKTSQSDANYLVTNISNQSDFNNLCASVTYNSSNIPTVPSSWTATVGGVSVSSNNTATNCIVGVQIGQSVSSIPSGFLAMCKGLYFPISLGNVTSIGDCFLYGCSMYNTGITLPEGLVSIGRDFMTETANFKQLIGLPSTLTHLGDSFIYNSYVSAVDVGSLSATIADNSTGRSFGTSSSSRQYSTGIYMLGNNRSQWMTRFPNKTSAPYRKLKDGGY